MKDHERQTWIGILKAVKKKKKWAGEFSLLCDFAGFASPANDLHSLTPYCPKCILTQYVYENYEEIERISKDADDIHPKKLDNDYKFYEEFDFFIFASVCMFLEALGKDGLKLNAKPEELPLSEGTSEDDYLKPEEKKENIVFWCDKVIEWLERQKEAERKPSKKASVSKKKKPAKRKKTSQ